MDRTISLGMTGQDVRSLQDVLNFHIRRGGPLKVDGIFGPKTDARVREFQKVNGLKADGFVGPKTKAKLYDVTEVTVPLFLMPRLQLQFPSFGQGGRGLQPPQLIPPLHWPGPPIPAPLPFTLGGSFTLLSNTQTTLPALTGPPNALGFKITVPTRQDPADPTVSSRKAIIELIDDLPVNSKFKAFLISKVPNPVHKISPPDAGFNWGLSPLFNPLDPKGFGVSGNAQFTLRLTEGKNGAPNMVFGAWGDGKFFLNFETKKGEARPKVEAQGQVFLGVKGTF
jgi:peptidoglycan hydrolase-like protein with peptidoglycan-binding domain